MSDYRVTVKVRNARLLRAIENAGYKSIHKFAHDAGVQYTSIVDLINMTTSPLGKRRGEVRPYVEKIMDFLCEPFEALFTEQQCEALTTNKSERDVSAEQVFALMNDSSDEAQDPYLLMCESDRGQMIAEMLNELTDKERAVVVARNGFAGDAMTLDAVAAQYGVTRERIRQIECKALRKLRTVSAKQREVREEFEDYR